MPQANAINYFSPAKWVVSPTYGEGTHQTIASAIASASSGDTIFIMPGTYAESPTITSGINLTAFDVDVVDVIMNGTLTFSSATGFVNCSGIQFKSVVMSGTGQIAMTFNNCAFLPAASSTAITLTASGVNCFIQVINSQLNLNASGSNIFSMSGTDATARIMFVNCFGANADGGVFSNTASTISSGRLVIQNSQFPFIVTTSGTAGVVIDNADFTNAASVHDSMGNNTILTLGATGSLDFIYNSLLSSGTATALVVNSTLLTTNLVVSSSNTNAISGTGTINYGGINFITSAGISTTTQKGLVYQVGAPAFNYVATAVSLALTSANCIVGVTSNAAARTITLPNSNMAKGQVFTVKDEAGTAASANAITVSGNGANIDGASTYVINQNFASVDIYWNGTQFFVK
jgi:hypothetical protein